MSVYRELSFVFREKCGLKSNYRFEDKHSGEGLSILTNVYKRNRIE